MRAGVCDTSKGRQIRFSLWGVPGISRTVTMALRIAFIFPPQVVW